MNEIENFIYKHSSSNGCMALTKNERNELMSMIRKLNDEYQKVSEKLEKVEK